jgi:hypothetical protein
MTNAAVVLTASGTEQVNYDFSGQRSPRWSGGSLLAIDEASASNPIVRVFGLDGREISDLTLTIPQASAVTVMGVARGETGLVVACGVAFDAQGRRSPFPALFPPNSAQEKIVALGDYYPALATVASDGSVWLSGAAGTAQMPTGDVLRRFDANGKFLNSSVPANSFSSQAKLVDPHNGLAAAGKRIAFFVPREGRYIELCEDGTVIADVRSISLPEKGIVTGFALTNEGRILICAQVNTKPRHHSFYSFDRSSGSLTPMTVPNGMTRIYGAEGNSVVGRTTSPSLTVFTVSDQR